jgi:hypothetical protein
MFLLRSSFRVYIYGVTLSRGDFFPLLATFVSRFVRGQAVLSGLALSEIRTRNPVAGAGSMAFAIGGGYRDGCFVPWDILREVDDGWGVVGGDGGAEEGCLM